MSPGSTSPGQSSSARAIHALSPSPSFQPSSVPRRTKRACDACREKRLKCSWDPPAGNSCQRCLRLRVPCETVRPAPEDTRPRNKRVRGVPREARHRQKDTPRASSTGCEGVEPRYLGSTSVSSLLAASDPTLADDFGHDLQGLDELYGHHRVFLSSSGEQVVLVGRKENGSGERHDDETTQSFDLSVRDNALSSSAATQTVLLALMQSFAINFQPFYPVVSVAEMCTIEPTLALVYTNVPHSSEERNPFPPVLTKLAICSIAALHREVPRHITRSLLRTLQGQVEGPAGMAMMRRSNIANVQTALLLGVSAELHASSTFEGGSRSWLTVGSAIRMALDIGLHRDLRSSKVPLAQQHRRRRLWAALITADRWYATSFGQPMTINLFDCDAYAPSVFEDGYDGGLLVGDMPYVLHVEVTKLSILLGRVTRYAYSPLGMTLQTSSTLSELHEAIESWRSNLIGRLAFNPDQPTLEAGLLRLMGSCVEFAFLNAFIRPRQPISSQVTFRPPAAAWSALVKRSAEAIHWCATRGNFLLDTWFPVMYSLTCCFFAQVREYSSTHSHEALQSIHEAARCFEEWSSGEKGEPGFQQALRTKVSSGITCLAQAIDRTARSSTQPDVASGSENMNNDDLNLADALPDFWSMFPPGMAAFGENASPGPAPGAGLRETLRSGVDATRAFFADAATGSMHGGLNTTLQDAFGETADFLDWFQPQQMDDFA